MAQDRRVVFGNVASSGRGNAKLRNSRPFLRCVVMRCLVLSRHRDPMLTIERAASSIVFSCLGFSCLAIASPGNTTTSPPPKKIERKTYSAREIIPPHIPRRDGREGEITPSLTPDEAARAMGKSQNSRDK